MNLTVGSLLALRYSEEQGLSLKQSLRQVATLPPLWALAAALACKFLHVPVPEFILHGAGVLGAAVSALMILSLGMALKPERVDHVLPILTASGIKLLLSPLVMLLLPPITVATSIAAIVAAATMDASTTTTAAAAVAAAVWVYLCEEGQQRAGSATAGGGGEWQ